MIPFLLTGVGRWVAIGAAAIAAWYGAYLYGYKDGRAYEQRIVAWEEAERVRNAIRSGDDARSDPDRMRELDQKFCRDCK